VLGTEETSGLPRGANSLASPALRALALCTTEATDLQASVQATTCKPQVCKG